MTLVCSEPGCIEWATYRGKCSAHRVRYRQTTRHQRNERKKALRRTHGRCARCGDWADVVHHIIERQYGGSDEADNLEPLCNACHERVHA